jgi:hypothetical protein
MIRVICIARFLSLCRLAHCKSERVAAAADFLRRILKIGNDHQHASLKLNLDDR